MKNILLFSAVLYLSFTSCQSNKKLNASKFDDAQREKIMATKNNLEQLTLIMPGIYTNTKQFNNSDQNDFYHIIMKLYPIWEDRDDAKWFYVEQAQFDAPKSPYRQRVYKIIRGERDTLISNVYTLPEPKEFIGAEGKEEFWKNFTPSILVERKGCAVYLTKKTNSLYTGATKKNTCSSTMAGASFAESEVTIGLDEFTSLDIGYNDKGVQVWGPTKGAYRFEHYIPSK